MTELVIEKGIEIPESKTRSGTGFAGALRRMDIGDSVLVTDRPKDAIRARAAMEGTKLGRQFVTRVVPGGTRVWRVA